MSRRVLLRRTCLGARELRRIDPSLSLSASSPIIVVLDEALLLHLGAVRLVVTPTHAYVFNYQAKSVQRFLSWLSSRLALARPHCKLRLTPSMASCQTAPLDSWAASYRSSFDEEDESFSNENSNGNNCSLRFEDEESNNDSSAFAENFLVPFELEVLEAALLELATHLEAWLKGVQPRVEEILRTLPSRINAHSLEELRSVKNTLNALSSQTEALRKMILETLDDDEDISRMMISKHERELNEEEKEDDEEEIENLLEYYLQRFEACFRDCENYLENLRDLEESINLTLASRRLEVGKLELMLSIWTCAIAVGALISGIFGMNLTSHIETHAIAFYHVAFGILVGILLLTMALYTYLKYKKIF